MKVLVYLFLAMSISTASFAHECFKATKYLQRFDQQWSCELINGDFSKAKYRIVDSKLCLSIGDDYANSPTAIVTGKVLLEGSTGSQNKLFSVFDIEPHKSTTANPDWGYYEVTRGRIKIYSREGDIANPRLDVNYKLDTDYGVLKYQVKEVKILRDKLIQKAEYGCKPYKG